MLKKSINFRLAAISLAAGSVGLSMAIISLAKVLLLVFAAAYLLVARRPANSTGVLERSLLPATVLLCLAAMTASLIWTVAPPGDALSSLGKYGKLLVIPVLMLMLRSRRETLFALAAFGVGQIFLVLSSWMIFMQLPVPWATSNMAVREYAVFSSYLDQGIMGALFAALAWHLRHLVPGRFGKHIAIGAAFFAISNVLFVLSGRSGHVVAIAMLSLAIMWELPRRYRPLIALLPFLLVTALFFSSTKVRDRLTQVQTEVQDYSDQTFTGSSSGIRLGLWVDALQLIAERPLAGSGLGSWSTQYNRLHRAVNPAHKDIQGNGNPHQEYLQWGVQLGVPGILLFLSLFVAAFRDSLKADKTAARATQSVLVAFGVACLFNSSLYDALIGDFFCVTLGLTLALGLHPDNSDPLRQPA